MVLCCFSGSPGGGGRRKKEKIPEAFLKPHGLYDFERVDLKRLKKLIVQRRLAPCYPREEDCCVPEVSALRLS